MIHSRQWCTGCYCCLVEVRISEHALAKINELRSGRNKDPARVKKIAKALRLLSANPRHPGLKSHRFDSLDSHFGAAIWESYIENHTPGAWRVWWMYGPDDGTLTIVDIGPHP